MYYVSDDSAPICYTGAAHMAVLEHISCDDVDFLTIQVVA